MSMSMTKGRRGRDAVGGNGGIYCPIGEFQQCMPLICDGIEYSLRGMITVY